MDLEKVNLFKKLAIYAMFSDDTLLERLVLKGGNAIDLIHNVTSRASWDLDFSIEGDFQQQELLRIKSIIQRNIEENFSTNGYKVFDFKISEQPKNISPEVADFWGGYFIEFKIISKDKFDALSKDISSLRRNSEVVGARQGTKFIIEISKYEFCKFKEQSEIEGLTVYVYSPTMIIIEKLRAICQQMPEYLPIVKKTRGKARARDFFDIYLLLENFSININTKENIELLQNIFAVKKVPLNLLTKIKNYKEFHRPDFIAVENTVAIDFDLKEYDFYFDYVVEKVQQLKSFGKI